MAARHRRRTCPCWDGCAAACPTGALVDRPIGIPLRPRSELERVDTICPYCGVGCALTYHVDKERNAIVFAEGIIRDLLGEKGFLDAEVQGELQRVTETTRGVHFDITPGGKTRIRKIDSDSSWWTLELWLVVISAQ